jgi:hypothetical protein
MLAAGLLRGKRQQGFRSPRATARFILCPLLCKLSISAFRSISTSIGERSGRCQKIFNEWKDSLDCGSPAAAFAETALLSGSLLGGKLRRRDLQSLSEITSPKALDEKRPVSGRLCFRIRMSVSKRHARSRAASRKAAAGLPQPKGHGQIHPLPFSLQTQHLCVSFDINIDRGKVRSLPKNLQ